MVKPGMFISDRYEIIEKVGSGGMADVYRAMCHRLNRYVAIKILKPEFSADTSLVTKFRAEAQSAAGLSHPNIVSVYDVGDDGDLHYIVMELVEGITLKKFIEKKGMLDVKEAIGIAAQISLGLEAAHDNHIVHRDIKPQNIIISREGKVKVADFGIAKAATTNTVTQGAIGSVHYLSPEQARGGYSDEKSDIYSLGVTMYEMLCGKVPFAGDNTVSVALSHIQYDPVPVREVNPAVPYSVDMIVQKCMQKRPENRYLSASELIVDLRRAIMNPNGDFVQINTGVVSDSPTKSMTQDELAVIKSAAKSPVTRYEGKQQVNNKILREEEEELDRSDTKWDKLLFFVVIAVILTFMGAIIFVVVKFMNGIRSGNIIDPTGPPTATVAKENGTPTLSPTPRAVLEVVSMPNVVGRTLEDAKDILKRQSENFVILDGKTEYSELYPAGTVIQQYPMAYTDVMLDERIELTISVGAEAMIIPDYTLWNYLDAKTAAENDFTVRIEFEPSLTIESNRVIRTIPEREMMLEKGQELVLVVSRGEAVESVPQLIGLTLEAARDMLTLKNLEVGNVTYTGSFTFAAGQITFQSQAFGNIVPIGTKIDLEISSGIVTPTPSPTPTPTPSPTPTLTPTPAATPTPTPNPADDEKIVIKVVVDIPNNPIDNGPERPMISFLLNGLTLKDFTAGYQDFASGTYTFFLDRRKFPSLRPGTFDIEVQLNYVPNQTCKATITLQ